MSAAFRLVPVDYETVEQRCRCGKKLCIDVGGSVAGEVDALLFCVDCGVLTPESNWALFGARSRP